MRVYLSGPMTGIPDFNGPAFEFYTKRLRDFGFEVFSPHEMDEGIHDADWSYYIRRDLKLLVDPIYGIERLYLMPEAWKSRGARLERMVAEAVGIEVWDVETGERLENE
jgi:hypothetical protein